MQWASSTVTMLICCSCTKRWKPGISSRSGGHIDDLIPALAGAVQHQGFLVVGEAVVQKSRCHTGLHKSSHLILHQAHQRRHHQRDARQQQGGHLIADGLTGTGGHHGQHVLPGQQALHDLLLPGAEAVVA